MSDIPAETAKQPLQPWQYIAATAVVAAAVVVLWFFVHGDISWRHEKPKPIEHSAGGAAPVFHGATDVQEVAAKQNGQIDLVKPLPPVDESAEFNAPIMDRSQQASAASYHDEGDRRPVTAEASAAAAGGGLFTATAVAYRVPHPMYTVRKGTLIPCADVTAIDTGAGGAVGVTAVLTSDVWGMGHKMVLMGKGTTVVGEIAHGVVNGLDRIGVAWREFTTPEPDNIGVSINSPAAGPLGEGGLEGDINRHEWPKVKGIIALSLLQGGLNIGQALAQSRGSTNINFSSIASGGNEVGNTLLQANINIPDTIHRDQGLACSIYLAQDVDFSHVYSARIIQ